MTYYRRRTSEIYIAHSRHDRRKAALLAEALTGLGQKVVWETRSEDRELPWAHRYVVALWTKNSVREEHVLRAARQGLEYYFTASARIDFPEPDVPIRFPQGFTQDLTSWDGDPNAAEFRVLYGIIQKSIGELPWAAPPGGVLAPGTPPVSARPGSTWRDERSGLTFAFIPAGEFLMGAPIGSWYSHDDAQPPHVVRIERPFYMATTPVTEAQYNHMCGEEWYRPMSSPLELQQPATKQDWSHAAWACDQFFYRLPSEAEWEYACRGGTTTCYWSGDTEEDGLRVGWCSENLKEHTEVTVLESVPANPFGLRAMHGVVKEWCEDTMHDNYDGAPTDGTAWVAPGHKRFTDDSSDGSIGRRVVRGGSWLQYVWWAGSAMRIFEEGDEESSELGFRPVLDIPT